MPTYKIHLALGAFVALVVLLLVDLAFDSILKVIAVCIVYSLLPDIDIGNSKISRSVLTLGLLVIGALMVLNYFYGGYLLFAIIALALLVLLQLTKHRGFIHSIRAAFLFSLPLLFLGVSEFVLGVACFIFHLAIDKSLKF